MVSQLKGLLGKSPRHIIVCGKLYTLDRAPYTVYLDNYNVVFGLSGVQEDKDKIEQRDGELKNIVRKFEAKYGPLFAGYHAPDDEDHAKVYATVDAFTGAILIETQTYRELATPRLHGRETQLTAQQTSLVNQFAVDQFQNYFEIFIHLLNRRIVAQHMPIIVKCHMVRGLFQPVIVETSGIASPFRYGEASWLYDRLKSSEVFLERKDDGVRKLDFSCIAMCDLAAIFNMGPIRELDRRDFIFMLTVAALDRLDAEAGQYMIQRYGYYANHVMGSSAMLTMFDRLRKL